MEDKFKELFDDFQPEVDPQVWTKISSRLPASSGTPSPGNGSAVTKSFFASTAAKLAVIAGTVITAAVIYTSLPKSQVAETMQPVVQTEQSAPYNTSETTTSSDQEQINTPNTSSQTNVSSTVTKPTVQTSPFTSTESIHQPADAKESPTSVTTSTNAEAVPQNANTTPDKHTAASSSPATALNDPTADNSNKQAAPFTLMLSTRGGFAPLSVTCLTNQTDVKADFDFGDGTTAEGQSSITHRYENSGSYTIRCTSGDKVTEQTIEVIGQLPTAFSPNGDGINDAFVVGDEQASNIELKIFNRNGRMLYRSSGKSVKWDGHGADDVAAETGTYFYDIFVTSQKGVTYQQKGTINLFR